MHAFIEQSCEEKGELAEENHLLVVSQLEIAGSNIILVGSQAIRTGAKGLIGQLYDRSRLKVWTSCGSRLASAHDESSVNLRNCVWSSHAAGVAVNRKGPQP